VEAQYGRFGTVSGCLDKYNEPRHSRSARWFLVRRTLYEPDQLFGVDRFLEDPGMGNHEEYPAELRKRAVRLVCNTPFLKPKLMEGVQQAFSQYSSNGSDGEMLDEH
jgi:hypothetical protein